MRLIKLRINLKLKQIYKKNKYREIMSKYQ